MKKFNVLFTALLCASVMFVGCSDDDDENGEGPGNGGDSGVVILPKKVVRVIWTETSDIYTSKDTTLYDYDAEGRLLKTTELDGYDDDEVTDIVYASNKITLTDNYSTDIIELENGRATKVIYDEGKSTWESIYSYSNNYISKIDDGDEDEKDEYIFTVTDGNLMKVVNNYTDEEMVSTITTITYESSDFNNNINLDLMPFLSDDVDIPTKLGVAGYRFKKLPAKETIKEKGKEDEIYTYKYEFNTDGYVTKITETENDGSIDVFEITYED